MCILKRIAAFYILIFFVSGCNDTYQTIQNYTITPANKPPAGDSIVKDSASNFYFSRIKLKNTGGLCAKFILEPQHKNKRLCMVVSGKIRSNYPYSNATVTFAASDDKGEVLIWRAIFLKYYFVDRNTWCPFRDSIFVEPSTKGKYYRDIIAFAYLGPSEKENFDIDTLKLEVRARN